MKILVFIEHNSTVRHFIDSGAFSILSSKHEVKYVLPFGHKRLGGIKIENINVGKSEIISLPACDSRLYLWNMRFFVELLRKQKGWKKSEKRQKRNIFKKLHPFKTYLLFRFLGLPGIFNIFTLFVNKKLKSNPNLLLNSLLKKENPDLIIHPSVLRGLYINDLVDYGNQMKIPIVVVMNSWDNPCSKRSVVSNNYKLLVWGPQSKNHAERLMSMKPENIIEFGAAQFDVYKSPARFSRSEILINHRLDPKKLTILYAGTSKETDEFAHLVMIDDAISSGELPKINIIYRPHPWGAGGRNPKRFINYQFKNVSIDLSMRDYLSNIQKSNDVFYSADYLDTRDIIESIDAVISPLSTILVECMVMGKAPLCFMPVDEKEAHHFMLSKESTHVKEMLNIKEILVVWGRSNLINGIRKLIANSSDKKFSKKLKKSSEFFVKNYKLTFKERIVKYVESL